MLKEFLISKEKKIPLKYSLLWLSQLSLTAVVISFLIIYAHCGSQESSEQRAILELPSSRAYII